MYLMVRIIRNNLVCATYSIAVLCVVCCVCCVVCCVVLCCVLCGIVQCDVV